MEHITTYTGEDFNPLNPDITRINIEDIAHALSMTCRANGHFKHYYSVAQHSINCAYEAKARGLSERVQLACLLHDGSEAYISDITRPVKKHLPRYLEIENHLQDMIYGKFLSSALTDEEQVNVTQIDNDMLESEFNALMGKRVFGHLPTTKSTPSFEPTDYVAVENMYMRLADSLLNSKKPIVALGIDGCRFGWCVVVLDSLGNSSLRLIEKIDELLGINADIAIIDMPIGLTDSREERAFDRRARSDLGNRRNSVFPTPCRKAIYEAETYEEACEINMEVQGKKISRQSWALIPKIKEVDEFLHKNPDIQNVLIESHPELCFRELLNHPCEFHKRDIQGEIERVSALREHMDIFALLNNHFYTSKKVSCDDIIDAAVLSLYGLRNFPSIIDREIFACFNGNVKMKRIG